MLELMTERLVYLLLFFLIIFFPKTGGKGGKVTPEYQKAQRA